MPYEAAKEMLRRGAERVKRASEGMVRDFDVDTGAVLRRQRQAEQENEDDQSQRARAGQEGSDAFERLKGIAGGEKPTRESTEEYSRRKRGEAAKEMLRRRSPYRYQGGVRG